MEIFSQALPAGPVTATITWHVQEGINSNMGPRSSVSVLESGIFPVAQVSEAQQTTPYRYFLFSIGAQAPVGQFNGPAGVAVAPDGSVYVADTDNHRIQHFGATGIFLEAWGSLGSGDGQFAHPSGVAVAPDGTVYVADSGNHRIQRFSATGGFLGKWGSQGTGDGQFAEPTGIAVAPDGTVYVADTQRHCIQRFGATGGFLGRLGTYGSGDGQFYQPGDIATAPDGTVYVADTGNARIQRFSAAGGFLGTWGSRGSGDGQFTSSSGVAVAPDGTVYVADAGNARIQRFSAVGDYVGKWGTEGFGDGQLRYPKGVAVAPDGTVYVADTDNNRIQRFSAVGDYVGKWGTEGFGDGQFDGPGDIAVASGGTIYVADTGNHRIQRFSAAGAFLGTWGSHGSGDGQFAFPWGVAVAPDGTVYVADTGNDRIQHFSTTGDFLGKWGSWGYGDGQFARPAAVGVAPDGTVYVADSNNHRIQRFSATGEFLGKWGSKGSGDGQFYYPRGVAVASDSTVYVADTWNHRIQRFSATGDFLGKWGSWGSGDGQFDYPEGTAVAPDGTVYVADNLNYRIQRFSAMGGFLGKWGCRGSGDGQFEDPRGVAVAPDGTVYVPDTANHRIQAFGTAYPSTWRGEYFGNRWLAERPLLIRNETTLNFDWAGGSPDPSIPADFFSSRWQRYVYFDTPGFYRFTLLIDDGGRLWVDDRLLIEQWRHPQRASYSAALYLDAGYHRIRLEYYDYTGPAAVSLSIQQESTSTPTPWTFILYLDGDNNLYPYLERAIRQLEAQPTNPNVNILVLFDGDRNNDTWRFLVQPRGNYTLGVNKWYMGELNMGNSQTLADFITWARDNYPAQHYYLAIADHGRGTTGIAWDDTSSRDNLTPAELRSALQTATNSGQWQIDVLHYDACLMALLENAYQVREYADYLVASQNLGWSVFAYEAYAQVQGTGVQGLPAPYEFAAVAARVTAATTPPQLAVQITDSYFNHPAIQTYPRTISALDLSRVGAVRQAVDNLSSALRNNLNSIKTYIQNTRSATQKFDSRDYYKITDEDEYLDLYHFAQRLRQYVSNSEVQAAAQGVMDAIANGFVVAEHHQSGMWGGEEELYWDLDNAHGVSVYFPPRSGSSDYTRYTGHQLFRFTADSAWDDFLVDYFGMMGLPPEQPTEPGLPPMLVPEHKLFLPLILRNR